MPICSAQLVRSNDNRISVDVPTNWTIINKPSNDKIHCILCMQKKNNPKHLIMFTVNHFYEKYSTFRDYSDSERDMFGRRVTEKIIADLKARGASVSVNGIDINEHYLMFGITCSDKNTSVAYVQMCFIKGHHVHTLIYMSPTGSQNVKECVDIISTITIDGMPIMDWIP